MTITTANNAPVEMAASVNTLVDVLRWRAEHQPDRVAFRFLSDGEAETGLLTYAQLDRQAKSIAASLTKKCQPNDRALLLYPPGLEFIAAFMGCLYARVIAVPLYCPRFNRDDPRIRAVTENSETIVALTTGEQLEKMEKQLHQAPYLQQLHRIATDCLPDHAAEWHAPRISGADLAFLQYTSGSTSTPRGVMISHDNLMANEQMISHAFDWHEKSAVVSWLPVYHDMGLIGNTLQPIYAGVPCVQMPPASFLQHPVRWLNAITKYRGTCIGSPNFGYDLCVRRVRREHLPAIDLSHVDLAYCGAEPVRQDTLQRFSKHFEQCGFSEKAFYPCYGLAEITLFATGGAKAEPPAIKMVKSSALEEHIVRDPDDTVDVRSLVGCGHAWLDEQIVIANPETSMPCKPEQIGEIWIKGPHVATGYWNDDAKTEQTFAAYLADSGDGPFVRTGDLGFLKDRELFITGRLKDLIIIRGRNHYPQDIELTVERSHPALRSGRGAAFTVDVAGEDRLVIVHEIERDHDGFDQVELIGDIKTNVASGHELMVHAVALVRFASMPTTTSGKIQRHACRAAFLRDELSLYAQTPDVSREILAED